MSLRAEDRDPSTDPGDDFYRFANGGWLDANPIPAGYGAWGAFEEVARRNEVVLRGLLERAAAEPVSPLDRMLGDYYAAGVDLASIESGGLAPIEPFLDAVAAVSSHDDLMAVLPLLHGSGIHALFGWAVTLDHDDATHHLLWLAQAGLGLPDRDGYFDDSAAAAGLRAAYADHVAAQLGNLGTAPEEAADLASSVVALESRLAALHLRAEEKRDPTRTLNRHSLSELTQLAPGLDLPGYLRGVGAQAAETVNVQNPAYLAGLPEIVTSSELRALRAYLTFHVVRATADALPARFDEEDFAFYGRRVNGQQEQHERSKRVIDALTADLGEALSQRFVDLTFPPSAKDRALLMVEGIREEMRHSLRTRHWMGAATRSRAIAKLDSMRVKVGYPDRWRDWSGLRVGRESFAGNRLSAARFEGDRQLAKLDQPVDAAEWELPPHVVNAYYHPTRNEIVFPAGVLQPPFFDADADDAVNFGGVGTVIGHEITHGFDDQGRQFDADGAFRDWWTEQDKAHFTELADRVAGQFDGYVVLGEVPVNGRLTLGENIADLGGVALAQRAHTRVCVGAEPVDGLTPSQRFFLANATLWRANVSDELQRTLAQIDPHSPRHLRVLGPLSNLDSFQAAFALDDDAPMLRAREDRIEIW